MNDISKDEGNVKDTKKYIIALQNYYFKPILQKQLEGNFGSPIFKNKLKNVKPRTT